MTIFEVVIAASAAVVFLTYNQSNDSKELFCGCGCSQCRALEYITTLRSRLWTIFYKSLEFMSANKLVIFMKIRKYIYIRLMILIIKCIFLSQRMLWHYFKT